MAVIYVPPDRRWEVLGHALGTGIGAAVQQNADQQAIAAAMQALSGQDPNTPPGGSPGQQQAPPPTSDGTQPITQNQLPVFDFQKLAAIKAKASPNAQKQIEFMYDMALRQREEARQQRRDALNEQLVKADLIAKQHQAELFPLEVQRATLSNQLAEMQRSEEPVKFALHIREVQAHIAELNQTIAEKRAAQAAFMAMAQQSAGPGQTPNIKPAEPDLASPMSGYGKNYDLNNDDLAKSVRLGKEVESTIRKPKRSVSVGGMHIAEPGPGPAMSDRDIAEVSSARFMSETLEGMLEEFNNNWDPKNPKKLLTGPVLGKFRELYNKFKDDPNTLNDPNVVLDVLTGHQFYGGAGEMPARIGVQILRAMTPILVGSSDNPNLAINKILQQARLLRDNVSTLNLSLVRRQAQGYASEPFEAIEQSTHRMLKYEGPGTLVSRDEPKGGTAPTAEARTTRTQQAFEDYNSGPPTLSRFNALKTRLKSIGWADADIAKLGRPSEGSERPTAEGPTAAPGTD